MCPGCEIINLTFDIKHLLELNLTFLQKKTITNRKQIFIKSPGLLDVDLVVGKLDNSHVRREEAAVEPLEKSWPHLVRVILLGTFGTGHLPAFQSSSTSRYWR